MEGGGTGAVGASGSAVAGAVVGAGTGAVGASGSTVFSGSAVEYIIWYVRKLNFKYKPVVIEN